MDYEKKYNEALNWMRELYPGLHGATKEDAEHYFPELRESEDERIRKALVKQFGGCIKDEEFCHTGFTYAEITTWLEKQKINTEGDFGRGYDSGYQSGYAVAVNEMKPKVATATLDSEKQKEQKPCGCVNVESEYDKGWRAGHKAGLKDAKMQKPAWSEEDERIRQGLIEMYKNEHLVSVPIGVRSKDIIRFLENLRPSWKPNNEQMVALNWSANGSLDGCVSAPDIRGRLRELYNELKKL